MRFASRLLSAAMVAASLVSIPAIAQEVRVAKFGYGIAEDHPLGQAALKFSQIVEQRSAGKLKVKPYPANVLGSETAMLSSAQGGVQEMVGTSSAPLVGIVKEFALFDLPFLFANEAEADAVLDGPVGRALLDKLEPKGLFGLCYWETGFRNVTNSKRPIAKAEDLKGLKMRTMQNPVYIDAFNKLGAHAVPLPFTELYVALETKAVDGQENPYGIIYANKIHEVQKYLTSTRHGYSPFVVMVSKKYWDKLAAGDRKVMQDACVEAGTYQRKLNREANQKILDQMKAAGIQFNELPAGEIARMRQELQPVIEKFSKQIGDETVRQAMAEIDKVRRK